MKKFLSLILALTLVASLFTVNVMAATGNTVTITPDKTTGLVAGETITVEVAIDATSGIKSMEYALAYDTDVFEVDMNEDAYQDYDWYTEITRLGDSRNKTFANYLGSPVFSPAWDWDNGVLLGAGEAGKIKYAWAGSTAVAANKSEANKVIGRFFINVKSDVADGTTATFSLVGLTNGVDMVCEPVTVTVGTGAPAVVEPTFNATADMGKAGIAGNNGKNYDNAFGVTTKINAGTNTTEVGIVFAPKAWLAGAALVADKAGVRTAAKTNILGAGAVDITAAIIGIPRAFEGKDIVMVTVPYAFDGTSYAYGAEVDTTVNFANTGE